MLDQLAAVFTSPITLGVFALFALLAALETLRPRRRLPSLPGWRLKGTFFFLLGTAISGVVPLVWDEWFAEHRLIDARGLGNVGGALAGFLAYEAVPYAWHRALHRFDFLWRWFHQMHHSAERIDVFGAFYLHPFDFVGFSLVTSVALVGLLGLTPYAALAAMLAITACNLFQHANLSTPRWLGYLVQRPENHAVHHERGSHAGNYGDIAIFDMLLGTFRNPRTHEGEAGFHDGASAQVLPMLLGRDVATVRREPALVREEGAVR